MQTGVKMDMFRIGVLVTKKFLSVEAIVQCLTGVRSANGYVIIGKVLDI